MNSILTFLQGLFTHSPGVLSDTRPIEVTQLDPTHEEVAAGGFPVWVEKTVYKTLSPKDQDGNFGCVSFATASSVEGAKGCTERSARDIYTRRSNQTFPGMIPFEALQLACQWGVDSEQNIPSNGFNETQLIQLPVRTSVSVENNIGAGGIPTKITTIDIDTIASILAAGFFPVLCFEFQYNEWVNPIPVIVANSKRDLHHENVLVDYTLRNGKKYLVTQDSWKTDTSLLPGQHRLISEEFLQRVTSAGYIYYSNQNIKPSLPDFKFTEDLSFGMNSDEVKTLQTKLQALGYFTSAIKPTGSFGGITKQAVQLFQKAYGIPMTGYVGPLTRAKLNSI